MDITYIILAAILSVLVVGVGIYIKGFGNWLVWAVSEAEAMFGSETGQLKLRYVYDLAVMRFPKLAKMIPFSMFGKMVDSALDIMRNMIEQNEAIAVVITDKKEGEA